MTWHVLSDQAILEELGTRLKQRRLDRNITQGDLALAAGVDRTTVSNLENGASVSLATLIQVLRALESLDGLEAFLPDPGPSPLELAKRRGRPRRRATGSRGSGS